MKRFLFEVSAYIIIVFTSFILCLLIADGTTDPFYLRFTTPKQENLILGTSRSAQGLQPTVIDSILNKDFFNYSFTIDHSPFGPAYLQSIKKKLNYTSKNQIFIVTVDPWSISSKLENPNDSLHFRENTLSLGTTSYVNMNPNIEYLIENFSGKYHRILFNHNDRMLLYKDGWLEVSIDMDSARIEERIEKKVELYLEKNLPYYKLSSLRRRYLLNTISFLRQYGEVYLVRMPIHPKMLLIDNKLLPNFNELIIDAISLSNGYLDMTGNGDLYLYTDGNHLHKSSGKMVSKEIANWINEKNNNK